MRRGAVDAPTTRTRTGSGAASAGLRTIVRVLDSLLAIVITVLWAPLEFNSTAC
jgi:hypothetical protein